MQVRVRPAAADEEEPRAALVAVLVEWGSAGVVEDGATLVAYLPVARDAAAVRASLVRADPGADIDIVTTAVGDWAQRWREGVRSHQVGGLRVAPPWLDDPADSAHTIIIDPGMAFGTGEHATTRGMLRLLCTVVRPGDRVADLGAGSGVLAIGAAKLGATRVAAIEMDPDAIPNAQANVDRNGVAGRVLVIPGDACALLPLVAPVRVISANIVSSVIIELLPTMATSIDGDGRAVLGGILLAERPALCEILDAQGWRVEAEDIEDEWWSTVVARA